MSDVVNEEAGAEPPGSGASGGGGAGRDAAGNDIIGNDAVGEAVEDVNVEKLDIEELDVGAVAAEFVLGTLDSEERAWANGLLESDPHFRGMVRVWERRLGELHLMVEPVDPPPPIWESIAGKLGSIEQSPGVVLPEHEPPAISAEKTRATLEALEAQLREEGLGAPAAVEAEALVMAPAPERAVPEHRKRADDSDRPARTWGFVAILMTLVSIVLAGLITAWRYFPDRLPPQLRAEQLLNIHPPAPPPVRLPPPPESRFDE